MAESSKEFERLEKIVNQLAESHEKLVEKVKELEKTKASSIALPSAPPAPPASLEVPKPFKLEGVGTVTLKYPKFSYKGKDYLATDVAANPETAQALYVDAPSLFIKKEGK